VSKTAKGARHVAFRSNGEASDVVPSRSRCDSFCPDPPRRGRRRIYLAGSSERVGRFAVITVTVNRVEHRPGALSHRRIGDVPHVCRPSCTRRSAATSPSRLAVGAHVFIEVRGTRVVPPETRRSARGFAPRL
jgi:hypothetical protein